MFNLVIFGAPGSGKGTQSEKLIDRYGLTHISTGDVLRKEIAAGSELGKIADSYISKGQLIPDDLMVNILASEFDRLRPQSKGFIFDGFPRTIPQAEALKKMLEERGEEVHSVIGLEVADEELMERLIKRGADSGRSDDNPETIGKRLKVYHSTTSPLRDYYTTEGTYRAIQGSGRVDEIFSRITEAIESQAVLN
ncbi:adenylate kinase [Duncaniella sp.]|uniref:adenylate kinase n=1 Tax=Duncaniella sp. TaxID=2518496 RepID=UPI0023BC0B7A|nr:adenylate kinase [Duncaniella sp.]MDE5904222.1 adenylate kinase [Duncaniella sp.]